MVEGATRMADTTSHGANTVEPTSGSRPRTYTPPLVAPVVALDEGRFVDPAGTRILIAILACEKYEYRADSVRESWLPLVPEDYRVVFVYGRPGEAAELQGDRLYLDCPEAYEMLPRKVHALLEYALSHFEFDYLFKTDDDTYIDFQRFINLDLHSADYVGQFHVMPDPVPEAGKTWHYGKCNDKAYEVPYERPFVCAYATGGGYFLSRRAVEIAAGRTAGTKHEHLYEDVMIGEALTGEPQLMAMSCLSSEMGVINPVPPKVMQYVQEILLEKRQLAEDALALRHENVLLQAELAGPSGG
jgi:hypothetical protein